MGNAVCAIIGQLQGAAGCCNGGSGLTATTQVNNGADTLHWGDLKLLKGQKVAAGAIAATSNGLRAMGHGTRSEGNGLLSSLCIRGT